jgi:hypothetical protein
MIASEKDLPVFENKCNQYSNTANPNPVRLTGNSL